MVSFKRVAIVSGFRPIVDAPPVLADVNWTVAAVNECWRTEKTMRELRNPVFVQGPETRQQRRFRERREHCDKPATRL